MPSDTSAGTPPQAGPPQPPDGGDLVFAAHDLGRDRPPPPPRPDDEVEFAPAPRPGDAPPPPPPPAPLVAAPAPAVPSAHDGFVIRDLVAGVPTTPVDALVVSAPAPSPAPGAIVPKGEFRIHSTAPVPVAGGPDSPLPWTVRDDTPSPAASRRGWTARQGGLSERSAQDTLRRLREDAVHVTWRAAWLAVTSADNRLFKERNGA
ncbi:MAG TPA: hypothetical protein VH498_07220 [Candidatus Dormibacteraeota bacterium]|nr:hypothetical protein [Candidatus Dormibacteraeota bacterium]